MMKRFLIVNGRPGVLVADPHALHAEPRRFAGQRRAREYTGDLAACFDPVEQVIADHPMLRKAIARGELIQLDVQVAESADKVRRTKKKD